MLKLFMIKFNRDTHGRIKRYNKSMKRESKDNHDEVVI